MLTRQRFIQAHRSHLYQQLAARIGHQRTTVAFACFGAVWLAPLAALSIGYPQLSIVWIVLAVLPLASAAVWFRAGLTDPYGERDST